MRRTKEVTGPPEHVARAFLRSVLTQMGMADMPAGASQILEEALLDAVITAMALDLEGGIPFEVTANAMASLLAHAADTGLHMSRAQEEIQ